MLTEALPLGQAENVIVQAEGQGWQSSDIAEYMKKVRADRKGNRQKVRVGSR